MDKNREIIKKIRLCFDRTDPMANYAFSLLLFCHRLYSACMKKGISEIFFFAREGRFLKELFDAFCFAKGDKTLITHYLFVSRNSTFLPSLSLDADDICLTLRKKGYTSITFKELFSVLSSEDLLDDIFFHTDVDRVLNEEELEAILKMPKVSAALAKRIEEEKRHFLTYLENEGFHGGSNQCIVDVGWHGTMQDHTAAVLEKDITGFYLGCTDLADRNDSSRKHGLLFDALSKETYDNAVFSYQYLFFETVLLTGHGKTESYSQDGTPVLKEDSDKLAYEKYSRQWQTLIFGKFRELLSFSLPYLEDRAVQSEFTRLHKKMWLWHFKKLHSKFEAAGQYHKDGFFSSKKRYPGIYILLSRIKQWLLLFFSHKRC